jgi:hypothetical protein
MSQLSGLYRGAVVAAEGAADGLVDSVVLAVDAVGVDLEQDGDAVPSAPSGLGCRDIGVEPQRDGGVAQVVGAPGEGGLAGRG